MPPLNHSVVAIWVRVASRDTTDSKHVRIETHVIFPCPLLLQSIVLLRVPLCQTSRLYDSEARTLEGIHMHSLSALRVWILVIALWSFAVAV